jgi:hypothetical protein
MLRNFFVRNLPIFEINKSVCPWQTFPAKSFDEGREETTRVKHLSGAPLLGSLLALTTNITVGWKSLPETNTLAYSENS